MAIFKRGKKWVCVTFVARIEGKQCRIWRTFSTRNEAEACEARQTLEGSALAPARLTVCGYLTERLDSLRIRTQSKARYQSVMRHHLIPALGHLRLLKVESRTIEDFIKRMADASYSTSTIRVNIHVLNAALNRAVNHRLLKVNPVSLVDLPAPDPSRARTWDSEQVRLFLGSVKRSRLHALFVVTVATGLRSCEVRALREEDYDPPFLHVRQKVRRVRGAWIFDDYLKTRSGERVVTLPPKEAGIPRIRFHDLRHTQGTVLANAGVAPQIIQRRLGHSRIGVTMDLYAPKTPGQDAPAAEALERLIGGSQRLARPTPDRAPAL